MKIYELDEDGERFCIRANTMHEAIKLCEEVYLQGFEDPIEIEEERIFYHTQILRSCSLIGELKN